MDGNAVLGPVLDVSPGTTMQDCNVNCLLDMNGLQHECDKRGLLFCRDMPKWDFILDTPPLKVKKKRKPNQYEVERIIDRVAIMGEEFFFIKWRGWGEEFNSWEPKEHLNCPSMMNKFKRGIKNDHYLKDNYPIQKLNINYSELTPFSKLSLSGKFIGFNDKARFSKYIKELPKLSPELLDRKREVLQALRTWEAEINGLCNDPAPIIVENEVDLEGPPQNFHYINDYKASDGINIPDDPLIGCECGDCYQDRKKCCGFQSGGHFAYNQWQRVKIPGGSPIYECNNRCQCGQDCINRVVQKGRKFKVAIFRTDNGCGWGVKALEKIKQGSFVMEYVGEVITSEDAEKRGKKYDAEGRTYLFDLDYNDGDCPYTVDAAYYGNVSHFMNHSCDPNLVVYGVWINTLDLRLPRIAFFATRDVKKGEELTFDYMMTGDTTGSNMTKNPTSPGKNISFSNNQGMARPHQVTPINSDISSQPRITCKCNTVNCRKFLF